MITELIARLRSLRTNLGRRTEVDRQLDEELRAYVDLLAAEYERKGMSPNVARRTAMIETGGIQQVKEATRAEWMGESFVSTARELRYTVRSLRRSPVFLAVAVLTLAIGIGGATAVFTVINASLLRPLPAAADPQRLVTVERVQQTGVVAEFSYPDFRDLATQATALEGLAAFNGTSMTIEDPAGSDRAWVSYVSDNFFDVLGVRPAAGRLFRASDPSGQGGEAEQVVVLGDAIWRKRFGGSLAVIGSTVKLDGRIFTIIGVAPPGFLGAMTTHPMDVWIPITVAGGPAPALFDVDFTSRRESWLRLVGRLAPGSTAADAQRDLAGIAARLASVHPTNEGRSVQVQPGAGMTAEERADMSRVPRLLAGAVTLLLLIACGNVAGLSLVRAAARRRELATRIALGASRVVLVRQVVLEGAVIGAAAGVLGILLAQLFVRSAALVHTVVPMQHLELGLDGRVLAVALTASALTALLVSLMPALQLFAVPPGAVLKDGGAGAGRRRTGQRVLVAAQVGASVVLLAGAAIVYTAFQRVLTAHDSSAPHGLMDVGVDVRESLPNAAERLAFYRAVLERVRSEPTIAGAALTNTVPPFQWSGRVPVFREGEAPPPGTVAGRALESAMRAQPIAVSEGFFDVMRIPIVRGRGFTTSDDERAEPVAIVSRRMADELWPGADPIGQRIVWATPASGVPLPPVRVVGVAADTRDLSPSAPPPLAVYLPFTQRPTPHILLVRARGNTPVSPATVRRIAAEVNPAVAVRGGRTLFDRLRAEAQPQWTASTWIAAFGGIALLLASIGLYGVVAQGVVQRRRELAVRSALGATPGGLLATVLGDGMRIVAIGATVGGLGAIAAFRVLAALFTGVHAVDVRVACAAAAMLGVATMVAAYVPARRASRLNPVDALRSD